MEIKTKNAQKIQEGGQQEKKNLRDLYKNYMKTYAFFDKEVSVYIE